MYDLETRRRALALVRQGMSLNAASRVTGISRAAIREWTMRIEPLPHRNSECPRCTGTPEPPSPADSYAYLLGLYLGDGCLSPGRRGIHALRISCADAWPGLLDACAGAVRAVRPQNRVCRVHNRGCTTVLSYSKHWPCYFPQHGPGRKHERRITLEPWQQRIVDEYPWELVRGLIHSDGCRLTNWTTALMAGERKRYEYPRYFFTNKSDDIRQIFCGTLDRLGVRWTVATRDGDPFNISIARRRSVALMDSHVGPKY